MKKQNINETQTMREIGRIVAGAYYDHQEVRISSKNRIRDIIRKKDKGIAFDEVEEKKADKEKHKEEYIDKNIPLTLERMLNEKKLTKKEYDYINREIEIGKYAESLENKYKKLMMEFITNEPIWKEFLQYVKGVSMVLTSNLLKEFGYCEKFDNVAKVWKICGLHVVDGKAPKKAKGVKIDWNPKLRTLSWKISDSFIKQRTPVYRDIYDGEKRRQLALMENKSENAPKSKMHAELRARRKTGKLFLSHYWACARELAGLEVTEPYVKEKMGHKNIITWRDVLKVSKKKTI